MNINIHKRCQFTHPKDYSPRIATDKWSGELINVKSYQDYQGYIRVISGLYQDYIRVISGLLVLELQLLDTSVQSSDVGSES